MDPMETLISIALFLPPFLFALCFHEFAHGFVAKMRGDNTAEMMGRLTMNPLPHIDWIGTIGLPVLMIVTHVPFLFGWAKPVPVNPRNLKDAKNDMFWVALAGPMSNILLFIVGLFVFGLMVHVIEVPFNSPLYSMMRIFLMLNVVLAFFNLIPLHPLDGGKILARFLPYHWNRWLEDYQNHLQIGLMVLIISGLFRYIAYPLILIVESSWQFVISLGGL